MPGKKHFPALTYIDVNNKGYEEYQNEKDGSVLIMIPKGKFLMGSSDADSGELLKKYPRHEKDFKLEKPQREVYLKDFYIGKYELTNEQFARFVNESGYQPQGNWSEYAKGRGKHPVVGVTWDDAETYCKWAGLKLPNEAEWEKAARGTDGRRFPWGNKWESNLCNNLTTDRSDLLASRIPGMMCQTIPVGMIPEGASHYGALDMAVNVWELCGGWFTAYSRNRKKSLYLEEKFRTVRGGSWHGDTPLSFRCASRLGRPHGEWNYYTGFRCAR